MSLEIPPRPALDPPYFGSRAEEYADYSTRDLIDLIRRRLPLDDVDEEEVVEQAHARGEASHLDLLVALHERAGWDVYSAAKELCRDDDPNERVLGLMILRELGPAGKRPLFEEAWPLLEGMVESESDVDVLYWVLSCMRATNSPRVIDTMARFSTHPDDDIRRSIAFGIVGCGPEDPRVIEVQLRLAEDPDPVVRGHALYDFVNDIKADTPEIREVLTRLLDNPDPGIRLDAKAALSIREYR